MGFRFLDGRGADGRRLGCALAAAFFALSMVIGPADLAGADRRGDAKTTPPVPRVSAPPPYPIKLKKAGVAGAVVVEFTVNAKGRVEKPVVLETAHEDLSAVVLDTLKRWRFTPATVDGKPVAVRLRQSFSFGTPASGAAPPASP